MYTRMMIVEANSEKEVEEVIHLMVMYCLKVEAQAQIMSEEDGRMVVLNLTFADGLESGRCGRSAEYRTLLKSIEHFLVGNPVIKHFKSFTTFSLPLKFHPA